MEVPTDDYLIRQLVTRYPQLQVMLDALLEIDEKYDSDPVKIILDRWHDALESMICDLKPPPKTPVLCSIIAEAAE